METYDSSCSHFLNLHVTSRALHFTAIHVPPDSSSGYDLQRLDRENNALRQVAVTTLTRHTSHVARYTSHVTSSSSFRSETGFRCCSNLKRRPSPRCSGIFDVSHMTCVTRDVWRLTCGWCWVSFFRPLLPYLNHCCFQDVARLLREKAALQVIALECFTASAVFCFVLFCSVFFCSVLFCFVLHLVFFVLFCCFVFLFLFLFFLVVISKLLQVTVDRLRSQTLNEQVLPCQVWRVTWRTRCLFLNEHQDPYFAPTFQRSGSSGSGRQRKWMISCEFIQFSANVEPKAWWYPRKYPRFIGFIETLSKLYHAC